MWLILGVVSALTIGAEKAPTATTATGWFSDESCATERVKAGRIGPTGRSCTRECLAKGVRMAFIDEKARAVLRVENPAAARGQEGAYVRVTGSVDAARKTLHVDSVKVLKPYAATCDAPTASDSKG
jgi:hypothetical protein